MKELKLWFYIEIFYNLFHLIIVFCIKSISSMGDVLNFKFVERMIASKKL